MVYGVPTGLFKFIYPVLNDNIFSMFWFRMILDTLNKRIILEIVILVLINVL